jgi:hypothetical protein
LVNLYINKLRNSEEKYLKIRENMKKFKIPSLTLLLSGVALFGSFQAQGMFSGTYNWISNRLAPYSSHLSSAADFAGLCGGIVVMGNNPLLGIAMTSTPLIRSLATSYFQQQQPVVPSINIVASSNREPLQSGTPNSSQRTASQPTRGISPNTSVHSQIIREIETKLASGININNIWRIYENDSRIGSIFSLDNEKIYNFFYQKSEEIMHKFLQELDEEIASGTITSAQAVKDLERRYWYKADQMISRQALQYRPLVEKKIQQLHLAQITAEIETLCTGAHFNLSSLLRNYRWDSRVGILASSSSLFHQIEVLILRKSDALLKTFTQEFSRQIQHNANLTELASEYNQKSERLLPPQAVILKKFIQETIKPYLEQQQKALLNWLTMYAQGATMLESCPLYNTPREFEKKFVDILSYNLLSIEVCYAIGDHLVSYASAQLNAGKKVADVKSEFENMVILTTLATHCLHSSHTEQLNVIYQNARAREIAQEREQILQWLINYAAGTTSLDQCPGDTSTFSTQFNTIMRELSSDTIITLKQRVYADAQKILLQDAPLTAQTLRKISDHPIISILIDELLTNQQKHQLREMVQRGHEWMSAMKDHADLPREHILTIDKPRGITNINGNCYLCAGLQALCTIFRTLAEHNSLHPALLEKQNPENRLSCAFNRFISYYIHEDYERAYSHGRTDRTSINPGNFREVLFKKHPESFGFTTEGNERGGNPDNVVKYMLNDLSEKCKRTHCDNPCMMSYRRNAFSSHGIEHDIIVSLRSQTDDTQQSMTHLFDKRITKLPEILCVQSRSKDISYELDLSSCCALQFSRTRYRLLAIIYSSDIHGVSFVRYQDRWFLCSDGLIENITGDEQHGMKAALGQDNIIHFDQLKKYFSYFSHWVKDLNDVRLVVYERLLETTTNTTSQPPQRISRL